MTSTQKKNKLRQSDEIMITPTFQFPDSRHTIAIFFKNLDSGSVPSEMVTNKFFSIQSPWYIAFLFGSAANGTYATINKSMPYKTQTIDGERGVT